MTLLIPNSTQVPNFLLDKIMPAVEPAEWKVISMVCRKTFGWQKRQDRISLSQFEQGTGLSRPWLVRILAHLTETGLFIRTQTPKGDIYGLNIEAGELTSLVQPVNWESQLTETGELNFESGELSSLTKPNTKLRNLKKPCARCNDQGFRNAPGHPHRTIYCECAAGKALATRENRCTE